MIDCGSNVVCMQSPAADERCDSAAAEDRLLGPAQGAVVGRAKRVRSVGQRGSYQSNVRQRLHQLGVRLSPVLS